MNFYNEIEPFAAAWLRELIKAGAISNGEVSEKDMWDVVPGELMGFKQVHLCAGIGGWSAALRLAGWPDDKPVWTVSLPCQPFSAAGKGAGLADERGQLADSFFWLAGICRPVCIFGEQVEAAIKHDWWDVISSQLESIGYTVGAVGFPASSVGAFHLRQRLYWVAVSESGRHKGNLLHTIRRERVTGRTEQYASRRSPACGVADACGAGMREESGTLQRQGACLSGNWQRFRDGFDTNGSTGILGDSEGQGCRRLEDEQGASRNKAGGHSFGSSLAVNFWSDAEWIPCRDGKARPTKPGLFPLAHGVPNRVGTLRGAGNAIVPQAAAEFIKAFMDLTD